MKTIKQSKASKRQDKKNAEIALKSYIIKRDGSKCCHCGKYIEKQNRHLSHVISRKKCPSLTYDEMNVKLLCYYCHINWWHKDPIEAGDWFKSKYPERWEYLEKQQNKVKVVLDLKEIEQHYKNKLDELE